jgi:hypothetical protein
MIDRSHDLSITSQAKALNISRSTVYSEIPRIASVSGLDGAPRRDVRQSDGPLEARARPA